jgi:hypothetical protein
MGAVSFSWDSVHKKVNNIHAASMESMCTTRMVKIRERKLRGSFDHWFEIVSPDKPAV